MEVGGKILAGSEEGVGLWDDSEWYSVLLGKMEDIRATCADEEKALFQRDAVRQAPLLRKWNEASAGLLTRMNAAMPRSDSLGRLASELQLELNTGGAADIRPAVGHRMTDRCIETVASLFGTVDLLSSR